MKATTSWPIGNFAVTITAELTDEQVKACVPFAIKYLGQRAKIDRALGVQVKEGNKWVAKGKRGDVEFSEEHADALRELFGTLVDDDDEPTVTIDDVTVTVVENVRESSEVKWKAERAKIMEKCGDATKLTALANAVGFEFADVSELTVDNVDFCKAIREYVKKLTSGL